MGLFKYLSNSWRKDGMDSTLKRERLIAWRAGPSSVAIENPTRLDRARALGYRGKQGMVIVRQRVDKGSHVRPDWDGGRHSHNMGARKILHMNYNAIAERRAASKYVNCEVLNSYYVAEDGKHYWFEVILADRTNPQLMADPRTSWLVDARGRAERGLTSAGRKHRGLRHKGKGSEKTRPSRRSNLRRG